MFNDPDSVRVESDNGWCFAVKPMGPGSQAVMGWLVRGLGWAFAAVLASLCYITLKHRESLGYLALIDALTGIPNRRLLDDRLNQAMERQARHPQSRCLLLFLDLDGFKAINDGHGHRAGDAVLQALASRVRHCLRAGDTIGRWGGDEFVVLAEDLDDSELEPLAMRLRIVIENPVDYHGHSFQVGVSIGWAISPVDAQTAHELIRIADRRMYEDKQRRKDVALD